MSRLALRRFVCDTGGETGWPMLIVRVRQVAMRLGVALATLGPTPSRAENEPGEPLTFTVHPYGLEGETLDQKLARRGRSFRFICIGCARVDGRVAEAPFRPIETLNAAGLSEALATGR